MTPSQLNSYSVEREKLWATNVVVVVVAAVV
jgi:hypothetical protein